MENGVKEMTPENQMKFMEINKKSQNGKTVDMFEILPLFSENTMSQITDVMNDKLKAFDKLGEDTITQVVTPYTESLMKSAGVDTDQVRMNYLFKAGALMLGYAGVIFVCMPFPYLHQLSVLDSLRILEVMHITKLSTSQQVSQINSVMLH